MSPCRCNRPRFREKCQHGFTLLEILVVLVILGILAGSVTLSITASPQAELRHEAERLALLLEYAAQESRWSGDLITWLPAANGGGYRFERTVPTQIETPTSAQDDRLRARSLPEGVAILRIELAGRVLADNARLPFVAGVPPLFTLVMGRDRHRIRLEGAADGRVRVSEMAAEGAP